MSGPADNATDAIEKAVAAMPGLGVDPSAYRLVGVQSAAVTRDADPFSWQLHFKLADALPNKRGGKVGKGGELSLEVDLETGQVKKLRGGD